MTLRAETSYSCVSLHSPQMSLNTHVNEIEKKPLQWKEITEHKDTNIQFLTSFVERLAEY